MFHVYQIVEKKTGQPVYTGCTEHLAQRVWAQQSKFGADYGIAVIEEHYNRFKASQAEARLIEQSQRNGQSLLNKKSRPYARKFRRSELCFEIEGAPHLFRTLGAAAKYLGCQGTTILKNIRHGDITTLKRGCTKLRLFRLVQCKGKGFQK